MKNEKKIIYYIIVIAVLVSIFIASNIIEEKENVNITNQNAVITGDIEKIVIGEIGELPKDFSLEVDSNLQFMFFDVGQADCTLITDNGEVLLIDSGDRFDGKLLVEYMRALEITKIDYLIGTHAHEDHIGGMNDIIDAFDIGVIYTPYVSEEKMTEEYKQIVSSVEAKGNGLEIKNPYINEEFTVRGCRMYNKVCKQQ